MNCHNCGAAIVSTQNLEGETAISSVNTATLKMTDMSSKDEIIIDNGGIIGREGDFALDYFRKCEYISRLHCEVTPVDDGFVIEHLPTAKHPTKIDNKSLPTGVQRKLKDRSILTIADRNYRIQIETGTITENQPKSSAQPQSSEPKYAIGCRKCGTIHDVPSEDSIIEECSGCEDEHDKRDIIKVRARRIDVS